MADIDYTIRKLIEQQSKVDQGDIEVWLNTTYSFIEDYFQSYSTRASTFRSLISDYRIKKIGDDDSVKINHSYFKNKGLEYIKECIQYLNEQKVLKSQEVENKKSELMAKRIKSFDEFSGNNPANQGGGYTPSTIRTQLPFGIKPELFWTIFAAIVAVAFLLGLYFGQARFDKEKSDLYEENKQLKSQIDIKMKEIEKLNKQIEYISIKSDTTKTGNINEIK
jgi:hypothetical protein